MTQQFDIVVVGELNVDLVVAGAPDDLRFGQAEQLVDAATLALGSSGAITACGAARLGLRAAMVGAVGDDTLGAFVLGELERGGVDTRWCTRRAGGRTGTTIVLARGDDRAMLTDLGVTGTMSVDEIPAEVTDRARHLHVSSYFLQRGLWSGLPGWLRARPSDVSASLDPNWDPSETWASGIADVVGAVDWFLPNDAEARLITQTEDVGDAARALAAWGTTAVVTRGRDGAVLCNRDGQLTEQQAPTVAPVDTTGAGDSFTAGFLAAKLGGDTDREALELACACGALATLQPGGTAGQPTLDEARAFAAAQATPTRS